MDAYAEKLGYGKKIIVHPATMEQANEFLDNCVAKGIISDGRASSIRFAFEKAFERGNDIAFRNNPNDRSEGIYHGSMSLYRSAPEYYGYAIVSFEEFSESSESETSDIDFDTSGMLDEIMKIIG